MVINVFNVSKIGTFSQEYEKYGRFYIPYIYDSEQLDSIRVIEKTLTGLYTFRMLESLSRGGDFYSDSVVVGSHIFNTPLDTNLGKALYA